jgi:uncharacterized integral membrane protein
MGVLKTMRAAILIAIMLIAMAFAVLNNRQLVEVNLYWGRLTETPMAWVVFCAFLLGAAIGYTLSLFRLMELQGRVRDMKRFQERLESDLSTLRNLPLEDASPEEERGEAQA